MRESRGDVLKAVWILLGVVMMWVGPFDKLRVTAVGQTVVKDTANVKKPGLGKLYFSKKDSGLYVYRGNFERLAFDKLRLTSVPVVVVPPMLPLPMDEVVLGYWEVPERVLVAKLIDGTYWLMQTDRANTYYVTRGKNLLKGSKTVVTNTIAESLIASGESGIGGLLMPDNFPEEKWKQKGYVKDRASGEWRSDSGVIVGGDTNNGGGGGGNDKIKIPVGVIRWDSWATDRNDGNIVAGLRGAFTAEEMKDWAPWYSTFTEPEWLSFKVYNKDNAYKLEVENRLSSVRFDGDRPGIMEQEVAMARDAGIDFWAFNWYPDEATQSYARRQYMQLPDKKGMKAAYITELVAEENRILDHFVWAMKQDWYQRVDGKPLLILAVNGAEDRERQLSFYRALKGNCGCEMYVAWQSNDWASDKAVAVMQNNLQAGTLYGTWLGVPYGRRDHGYIMEEEAREWKSFLSYPQMDLGLNVTVSFTNMGVYSSPLNGRQADYSYHLKHSTGTVATDAENAEQLRRARDFVKANPGKAKYMMLYSWNEHTEGQRTVSPRKLRNGTIDRSVLDVVKAWVE